MSEEDLNENLDSTNEDDAADDIDNDLGNDTESNDDVSALQEKLKQWMHWKLVSRAFVVGNWQLGVQSLRLEVSEPW